MADRQARSRDRCLALTESETNRRSNRRRQEQDGGPYDALVYRTRGRRPTGE